MAKRTETTTREQAGSTADSMEQRMLAFAEQIGRIAGTMQAKAEGWLDRDTLNAQIANIRDGATEMLNQLAGTTRATGGATATESTRSTRSTSQGRQAKAAPKRSAAPPPKRQAGGKQPATKQAQAAGSKAAATKSAGTKTAGAGSPQNTAAARSGGRVDAPGKKHRGPMPSEGGATGRPRGDGERLAKLKAANMTRVQRRG